VHCLGVHVELMCEITKFVPLCTRRECNCEALLLERSDCVSPDPYDFVSINAVNSGNVTEINGLRSNEFRKGRELGISSRDDVIINLQN
jgi:hypothetical protein